MRWDIPVVISYHPRGATCQTKCGTCVKLTKKIIQFRVRVCGVLSVYDREYRATQCCIIRHLGREKRHKYYKYIYSMKTNPR